MRRVVFGSLVLLALGPALRAADDKPKEKPGDPKAAQPDTPARQLEALQKEAADIQKEAEKALKDAKPEDRAKIITDFRARAGKLADRFVELAEKHPRDKAALEALTFVLQVDQKGPSGQKAAELILRDHADSKEALELAQMLAESGSPAAEKLVRGLLPKQTSHEAQGQLTLALAKLMKGRADEAGRKPAEANKDAKEAEGLFEQVEHKFSDLKDLVTEAKDGLFELQHLAVGKVAPDIHGEDADGKKFALKDYRGKVVVLDFWAGW